MPVCAIERTVVALKRSVSRASCITGARSKGIDEYGIYSKASFEGTGYV